jgi:hypothetical protein
MDLGSRIHASKHAACDCCQPPECLFSGDVMTFTETKEPALPGTLAVKVESKAHVYMALDYTDETKPKLVAIEEV